MKDKSQIVEDWLPRYTGVPLDQFGKYILLTNFGDYLGHFGQLTGAEVADPNRPMPSATADGITMINFGMGSPNAATVMDLLSAIMPNAVLLLGKCGGLKRKNQLGDLVLPIAAIRGAMVAAKSAVCRVEGVACRMVSMSSAKPMSSISSASSSTTTPDAPATSA